MNIEQLNKANKRIQVLETELVIQADAHDQEIKELKAMVNKLKDGVTHFNRSGGDMNPLLTAYIEAPAQCLADVKADAVGDAMQKFRYEFEGARDTDSIESFFDDIESNIRSGK